MSEFIVSAKALSKSFRSALVLDAVSLDVAKGCAAGLVGNNGSGKSMLLKCLCGLIRPDRGQAILFGRVLGEEMDFEPRLGALIEAPGFIPQLSGYDNLKALWGLGRRVPLAALRDAMTRVDLDPGSRKRVGKYSMGMRQRLGIAQAIMEDPELLILDEPMNGLDNQGVSDMRKLFLDLKAQGKTILLASHNRDDIETLCDHVYQMDAGRIARVR